jgi:hypothetical protein
VEGTQPFALAARARSVVERAPERVYLPQLSRP